MSAMQWPFAERFDERGPKSHSRTTKVVSAAALSSLLGVLIVHLTTVRVISVWLPVAVLTAAAVVLARIGPRLDTGRAANTRAAQSAAIIALLAAILPGVSLALGPTAFVGVWLIVAGNFGARVSVFGKHLPAMLPGLLVILAGVLIHTYTVEAALRAVWPWT